MAFTDKIVNLVIRGKNLFSGTATEAEDSLESLQDQTKKLKAELKQLEDAQKVIKGFGDQRKAADEAKQAYESSARSVGELTRQLRDSEGAGAGLTRQLEESKAAAAASAEALSSQRQSLKESSAAQRAAETELKKLNAAYQQGKIEAGQYAEEQAKAEQKVEQAKKAHDANRQALEKTTQANKATATEVKELSGAVQENEQATSQLTKQLEKEKKSAADAKAEHTKKREELEKSRRAITDLGGSTTRLNDTQREFSNRQQELTQQIQNTTRQAAEQAVQLRKTGAEAEKAEGKIAKLGRGLLNSAAGFVKWGTAAAAAGASLAVGMLTRYTVEQAALASQLENTAQAIGVNTQTLQEYQRAFETVGIGADKTADVLKDVAEKIGDAYVNGGGEAKEAIDNLGLSIEELIDLSPDQQLLAIASALDSLPKAGQVQVLEALANDASLLQPLLENNAAGLRRLAAEARSVGAILEPEQIQRLQETDAAINRIQNRLQGLRNRLLGEVSPAVNQVADEFEAMLADNPKLVDDLAKAFGGLMRTTADWARAMIEHREQIGGALQGMADTAQLLGNSMVAVFRATQTVATGTLTVVGSAITVMHKMVETVANGLNWIGLVSDETMAKISARADAAAATVRDLARQTAEYGRQTLAAGADAINAFDNTAKAAERSAQRQQEAQNIVAQAHNDAAAAAEEQAERTVRAAQKEEAVVSAHIEKLIRNGANAKSALAGIFNMVDVTTGKGLTDLGSALDVLQQKGKASADEIRATLGKELEKLSTEDFVKFQEAAQGAFSNGTAQAGAMADAIESRTAQAFKNLGVDLSEVDTGIDSSMRNIIDSLEWVALHTENSGDRIHAAFRSAFDQADTIEELEALRRVLIRAGDEGTFTGDKLTNALNDVDNKITAVRNNAAGLGGDFGEIEGQGSPAVQRLKSEVERLRAEIASLRGDMRGAAREAGELDSAVRSATGAGSSRLKGPISVQTYSSQLDMNRIRGDLGAIEKEILNVQAELEKELEYRRNSGRLPGSIADVLSDTRLGQIQRANDELQRLQQQARQRQAADQPAQRAPDPTVTRVPDGGRAGEQVTVNFQLGGNPVASGQFAKPDAEALLQQLSNYASVTR